MLFTTILALRGKVNFRNLSRYSGRAGLARGGSAQWTWAGGIEIHQAEKFQRFVLTNGTLVRQDGRWLRSTAAGAEEIPIPQEDRPSLEATFLAEIAGEQTNWRKILQSALDALRISLAAEESMRQQRRIHLEKV